eukprot:UN27979
MFIYGFVPLVEYTHSLFFSYFTKYEGTTVLSTIYERAQLVKIFTSEHIKWVVKSPSSKIAILSINAYGPKTKHIVNHIQYAKLHGYNYFEVIKLWDFDPYRRPTWHKLPAIQEIFDFGLDFV